MRKTLKLFLLVIKLACLSASNTSQTHPPWACIVNSLQFVIHGFYKIGQKVSLHNVVKFTIVNTKFFPVTTVNYSCNVFITKAKVGLY
jgi:hypothetical protein